MKDLRDLTTHFRFGKNWESYARIVDRTRVDQAVLGLERLLPDGESLAGKRFLDIGSGSGLSSVAALQCGASSVVATDIDPQSIATTRALLETWVPGNLWSVQKASVFELRSLNLGSFEVVYSWGVLHHTGDLRAALKAASELVAPNGFFVFSLYRKTRLCNFWKKEKRFYAKARPMTQKMIRAVYLVYFRLVFFLQGFNFKEYIDSYDRNRGMDFYHDVHDWLGGYPYESMSPRDVDQTLRRLGFLEIKSFCEKSGFGWLGSGCDEYTYQRVQPTDMALD
jgi:2-polyprenyl-6-hydroxyphenyl methylase/3-demethylubiquinone-9 3-methyltransferase